MIPENPEQDGIVTGPELARIFNVTVQSVHLWVAQGMPKKSRGRFELAACISWRRSRDLDTVPSGGARSDDLDPERRLLTIERRRRQELENGVASGELLDAGRVKSVFMGAVTGFVNELDALPQRLDYRVVGVTGAAIETLLRAECDKILTNFRRQFDVLWKDRAGPRLGRPRKVDGAKRRNGNGAA